MSFDLFARAKQRKPADRLWCEGKPLQNLIFFAGNFPHFEFKLIKYLFDEDFGNQPTIIWNLPFWTKKNVVTADQHYTRKERKKERKQNGRQQKINVIFFFHLLAKSQTLRELLRFESYETPSSPSHPYMK